MALTFHTKPNPRSRIVRWMLEEVGCGWRLATREGCARLIAKDEALLSRSAVQPA